MPLHPINLLSFGPDTSEISLGPLNLIIGANGSGKSNLIEIVGLLRSSGTSIADVVRRGGGFSEWIWKGNRNSSVLLDAIVENDDQRPPLRHHFEFHRTQQSLHLYDEVIEYAEPFLGEELPYFFYKYQNGKPVIHDRNSDVRNLANGSVDADISILAQRKDPEQYPAITHLATQYGRIRLYREWSFGRYTVFREPQRADMRTDELEEDFSNLGLVLNRLRRNPQAKKDILSCLRDLYEGVTDFDISVEGGTVQVFFTEGNFTIPATRLSDGSLRYLCLLAILCDPTPPPLICIEEPELGLHPDILPKIADLLVEASARTQLIVTTHSDILVDAMTERPEAVLVCEKHDGQTQINRLDGDALKTWLEKYRLGELWTRGELGGTRW